MSPLFSSASPQLDLFAQIASAYAATDNGVLDNDTLYRTVAQRAGLPLASPDATSPVGKTGQRCNLIKRKIRWYQQDLRRMGIIEHVPDARGVWRLTEAAGKKLNKAGRIVKMVAFSTDLGVAIWSSCETGFAGFGEPIHLCVTSPPYPLAKPRAYGNPPESEYIDFICRSLEPIVRALVPGGSICLNISNDIFQSGSPARSLYVEELTLAMCRRLGLYLMDRIVWENPSKPPGPVQWASKNRVQLNVAYEPVLWFCNSNDPTVIRANNQRVLEPHSERHLRLIAKGGESRDASYCDGAYRIKPGSFGNATAGRIPRNVLKRGHNCMDSTQYRNDARQLGLPVHGAAQPLSIPEFLIKFLTEEDDLVVDPFGGTLKTAKAAENLRRRWYSTEMVLEYMRAASERFRSSPGFCMNPGMEMVRGRLAA